MVQGGGASGKIFDRGYKYIFGTLPKAEFYFQAAIEAAAKREPRVQTAALLYSNEAFDWSVADGSRQWLPARHAVPRQEPESRSTMSENGHYVIYALEHSPAAKQQVQLGHLI